MLKFETNFELGLQPEPTAAMASQAILAESEDTACAALVFTASNEGAVLIGGAALFALLKEGAVSAGAATTFDEEVFV